MKFTADKKLSFSKKCVESSLLSVGVFLLASCGGGDDHSAVDEVKVDPVEMVAVKKPVEGLFVARELVNFDIAFEKFTQITLENGESWISDDATSSGSPVFFAQGVFVLQGKPVTVLVAEPGNSIGAYQNRTDARFKDENSVVGFNANDLAIMPIEFVESEIPQSGYQATKYFIYPDFVPSEFRPTFPARVMVPAERFDYNKPASVKDVSGSWEFYKLDIRKYPAPDADLFVDGDGKFSGFNKNTGCKYSGSLAPRPSGKNVLNVNILLEGCVDAGSYSGIGYNYKALSYVLPTYMNGLTDTLKIMAINHDRTKVFHLNMRRSGEEAVGDL